MREKNPSAAHSVNSPAQQYLTSRNTCWRIQERSLSGVTSATIHALELSFSRATSSPTLQNSHLYVSSAASLPVAPVVWSITCFHTPARNLLPASNATTPAKSQSSWRTTWESTVPKRTYKMQTTFNMANIIFTIICFSWLMPCMTKCTFSKYEWQIEKHQQQKQDRIICVVTMWTFKLFRHDKTFAQHLHLVALSPETRPNTQRELSWASSRCVH